MIRALVAVLALALSGCTLEGTLRARVLQGPYENRGGPGPAYLAVARAMLAEGRPDAEVREYLTAPPPGGAGLSSEQAQAVLTLAYVAPPCADCGAPKKE